VQKAIAEEHHLEEIAKDGYAPATQRTPSQRRIWFAV
jgi:hypothetical protein